MNLFPVEYKIPEDFSSVVPSLSLLVLCLLLLQQSGFLSSGTEQISQPREQPGTTTFMPIALW